GGGLRRASPRFERRPGPAFSLRQHRHFRQLAKSRHCATFVPAPKIAFLRRLHFCGSLDFANSHVSPAIRGSRSIFTFMLEKSVVQAYVQTSVRFVGVAEARRSTINCCLSRRFSAITARTPPAPQSRAVTMARCRSVSRRFLMCASA